jgi:hypothetical protein
VTLELDLIKPRAFAKPSPWLFFPYAFGILRPLFRRQWKKRLLTPGRRFVTLRQHTHAPSASDSRPTPGEP